MLKHVTCYDKISSMCRLMSDIIDCVRKLLKYSLNVSVSALLLDNFEEERRHQIILWCFKLNAFII